MPCCPINTHRYRPGAHYMRGPGPKWREKHPEEWRRKTLRSFIGDRVHGELQGRGDSLTLIVSNQSAFA
jgi:hypothetical protein